ncbi:predicted protein [Uncinocarpus reesii 1704]|uniref:WSC domain-containing protein n=1 Tax=Uncinocarpus reesii (strain UAMH 1704) TaxID=336963 RepID=C4JLN9_UNCRE|nr:uncharacterized protein UREG_03747 [Uncinocarpus reesii 1704]EEP78901.1 predicted protein [Uncinocarpus reesii 1704]
MASALFFAFLYVLALLQACAPVSGIELIYCSSMNTGSNFDTVISDFQSNGACRETCIGDYAFAILQGKSCWCSDAAPGDTTDLSDCSDGCPGYPKDKCGNRQRRLFAYIQLDKKPSTTIGGSTTSLVSSPGSLGPSTITTPTFISDSFSSLFSTRIHSLATSLSVSRVVPLPSGQPGSSAQDILRTILTTLIQTGSPAVSSSETASSSFPSSTVDRTTVTVTQSHEETTTFLTIKSSSATTEPTTSQTPVVSTETVPGGIATITIPNSFPSHTTEPSRGAQGLNGGEIAGIVIGTLAGVGLLVVAAFFLYRWHQRKQPAPQDPDADFLNPYFERPVPTPIFHPPRQGPNNKRIPATLTVPSSSDTRLKNGIYANGGRRSNISLQDNQDYSRPVLRLTNPDPPESN